MATARGTYRICEYCTATRDQAAFALFNNEQSDERRVLEVRSLSARPINASNTTPGGWALVRTTAQNGGQQDLFSEVVKSDTGAPNVPPEVLIAKYCDVTLASNHLYFSRQLMPFSTQGLTLLATGGGDVSGRVDSSTFSAAGLFSSAIQSIVLREGEGVALVSDDPSFVPVHASWDFKMSIEIGGNRYHIAKRLSPIADGMASFGIFNGVGSGVVVELGRIYLTYSGQVTIATALADSPYLRVASITGYSGGISAAITTNDTRFPVPASVRASYGVMSDPMEMIGRLPMDGIGKGDLGYPVLNTGIVRKVGVFHRWMPGMYNIMVPDQANVGAFTSEFQNDVGSTLIHKRKATNDPSGIRLRPQQGVALICDNITPYSSWLVECDFVNELQAGNFRPIGSSVVRRVSL